MVPQLAKLEFVRRDTPDVTTFRIVSEDGKAPFEFMPGQCAMISVPPLGEAIFSITSSPTEEGYIECSIKKCGVVTDYLHTLEAGDEIGIRGPYGNNFPVELLKGKDLLFIGGGIGLAPLRSVINYVMDKRDEFGKVDIVYGARTPEDLVHPKDIFEVWPNSKDTDVHLTVDREAINWNGHVGFVPSYIKELGFDTNKVALVCGPPIMIKYVLQGLEEIGFKKEQVYTTLELKMKCGFGKCGRCNIGDKYVCKDGPVFRCDEITELPDEY
ncbi:MAG: FAD/NAD(P)-binding protein [Cetobacterium sp.]